MSFGKLYVGSRTGSFTYANEKDAITGVRVYLADDTAVLEGTEDSVLEVYVPLCTDSAEARVYAQSILSALSAWNYQPYTAIDIVADPAAQLGDGINTRGVYSAIFKRRTRLGVITAQEASAPCEEEVNHEFPWISGPERKADRKYTDLKDNIEAELAVQAGEISAKVSKLSPTGQTSFSWAMNDSSHVWYSNGNEVFRLDATGAHVTGEITATSGTIGGCSIVGGVLQVNSANIKSIEIGSNFKVDTSGNMTANNATILGTLNVGGQYISASSLYTGASQSAVNYGSWNTGTYYAYSGSSSYYNSIQSGTLNYPSSFKTAYLYVTQGISMSSAVYTPQTTTIAGVTIHYLGW